MKRVNVFIITVLILILASCSKNENNNSNTSLVIPDAGYIPFYPGNYWVYEHYKIDSLGNETFLETYDSVAITGTEMVNGIPYLVFEGTWMSGLELMDTVYLLRDSLGYYVDPSGWIHCTDQNFTDTLETFAMVVSNNDTLYEVWYKMLSEPQIISVPAGEFEALNYQGTIYTHNPNQGVPDIRYKDRYYSNNVGLVLDTYFYLGSPYKMERRLKHYYVDKGSFIF